MNFDITTILAIYGSFLATIIFIWEIIKYIRDKPRLKVEVEHTIVVRTDETKIESETDIASNLCVKMTNEGTKPIFIESAGVKAKNNDDVIRFVSSEWQITNKLEPNRSKMTCLPIEPTDNLLKNIHYGWALDETGKIWKSKKWPLRKRKLIQY